MSIVSKNQSTAKTNKLAQQQGNEQFLYEGFQNALSGNEGGIALHSGKWNGYIDNSPSVILYGRAFKVDAVHGYKGLPKNSKVAVRVAQNYLVVDFQ